MYKFTVHSPLRIIIESLVTLILHLHLKTYSLELPKLAMREILLLIQNVSNIREDSNLSIKHSHTDIAHGNSLAHGIVS